MRTMLRLATALALLPLLAARAGADGFTFTILDPIQTVAAGATADFHATIANDTGQDLFVAFSCTGPFWTGAGTPVLDDLSSLVPMPVAAGDTWTGVLFSLILPAEAIAGDQAWGEWMAEGFGFDGTDVFPIGDPVVRGFQVDAAAPGVVPEGGSLALLLSGVGPLALLLRRKRA